MDLHVSLTHQLEDAALNADERARLRCLTARQLEASGDYEAAREAMGELWRRIGEAPAIDGLGQATAAEVLLRAGVLSACLGRAQQVEGAQERAKDLISRSIALFEILREPEKVAEAQTELAMCYWREGAFEEARVILRAALSHIGESNVELKAMALLRSAIIEKVVNRHHDALSILTNAAPLFEGSANHTLKGKFHCELGNLFEALGAAEDNEEHTDRALVEYAAASFHFERAGHIRYRACVENNLGFLLLAEHRFSEAHHHLDRARQLFLGLRDEGSVAQVDDTRARAYLEQRREAEAEKIVRSSVRTLERGDENALLAEALTTHGTALARLGQHNQARTTLERAVEVAQQAGADNNAGLAAVTLIEELGEHLTAEEMRELYERADKFLIHTQHAKTLLRLRSAARRTLVAERLLMTQQEARLAGGAAHTSTFEQLPGNHLTHAWTGCQLDDEVRHFEGQLIRQALKAARGQITHAARLLGVTHQCLNNILRGRHRELLSARTPIKTRRRSIIRAAEKKVKVKR
jgi:tetratricopeptide (TPR) repeat protein